MPAPLNNCSLVSYLCSLNAAGWQTFANDMSTNFATAWSSRFSLTTRQSTAIGLIPAAMQSQFVNVALWAYSALSSSYGLDIKARFVDYNPVSSSAPAGVSGTGSVSVNVDASGHVTYDVTISINF